MSADSESFESDQADKAAITLLLQDVACGSQEAEEELVAAIYPELRHMAASRLRKWPSSSWQPTDLVHELFVKLFRGADLSLENRRHFWAAVGRAMAQLLNNRNRDKRALKRGEGVLHSHVEESVAGQAVPIDQLLDLVEGLEELRLVHPELAEVMYIRVFGGQTVRQAAKLLGCKERKVEEMTQRARSFLSRYSDAP